MLKGYNIVIGITGGIAAYKTCELISSFKKLNANIEVIMTSNATKFITPLTIETLTQNKCVVDTFERVDKYDVEHIALAKKADLFVVCPATANILGKLRAGIADDMLSTTLMATKAPTIICPAMNTDMYNSKSNLSNILELKKRGYIFVSPDVGRLACGDIGVGKLANIDTIFKQCLDVLMPLRDFEGKKVLISCGATIERIDPIRYISNESSGKMGMALASAFIKRGASVTVVCGRISVTKDIRAKYIEITSTQDMLDAIVPICNEYDYIVMTAAPADYTVKKFFENKFKGDTLSLELVKTPDISMELGKIKNNFKLICFAAESKDLISYAKSKMIKKNADMIVANDVSLEGAGFGVDTNIVTIIKKDSQKEYPKMLKTEIADIILDNIKEL